MVRENSMKEGGILMRERFVMGLVRLGVAAALVATIGTTEAQAGCFYSGSTKICSAWYTGSEICDNILRGLPGNLLKECDGTTGTCPVVSCTVRGAAGSLSCADPSTPGDDSCQIEGVAICLNPTKKYNYSGTAFNLPGFLTGATDRTVCTKAGRCTNFVELDPDPADVSGVCNNNWTFETFTATKFKGEVSYCPGGYASGVCCATSDRIGGACTETVTEARFEEYCTVNLAGYKPGSRIQYTCTPILP